MSKRDVVLRAMVMQQRFLISQRDFKLALGFIVRDWIVIHESGCSSFLTLNL
jgi:hypothetical protein